MELITKEQLTAALPRQAKLRATDTLLDTINKIQGDEVYRETFKETLIGFTQILTDSKYKLPDYINACKYSTYKLLGSNNIQSYVKTFPDRYQRLIDQGLTDREIGSYVSAYSKSKLVVKVLEQSLMPAYLVNAEVFQRAINVQADLMISANSEKVRTEAANSLLNHLKRPEAAKIELDVNVKEDSSIQELRNATMALAAQQRAMIETGSASVKDIAQSKVIEGEVVDE